jgi:Baseplate J-like protein
VIDHELNVSDGCAAELEDAAELERAHENRPGLPAVSYRLGRHGDFLTRMLKRLPNERTEGDAGTVSPLGRLTYRGQDDPTVALLDACASLLDVLAFYQERIANETFIRTAMERRSVLELARSIGYEMRPGVAASTLLAFTVDDAPGSPERVIVPVGTQVLSIPKKDELPQTFETVEPVEARVEWNQFGVQIPWTTLEQTISTSTTEIFVERQGPRLASGDVLLLVDMEGASEPRIVRVHRVTDFPDFDYRKIELQPAGAAEGSPIPLLKPRIFSFGLRTRFFGQNARHPDGRAVDIQRLFGATIQTPVQCVALASRQAGLAASGFATVPLRPTTALAAAVASYQRVVITEPSQMPDVPRELLEQIQAAADEIELGLRAEAALVHRTIRVWNLDEDREQYALDIQHTITALAFSKDDRYLAAATYEDAVIRLHVWSVSTGAPILSTSLGTDPPITQDGPVRAIVFPSSEDGNPYHITTINAAQEAVIWTFEAEEAPSLQPLARLSLAALGDLIGDRLQVEDGDRSLVGDDSGITTYRARRVLDTVPDDVSLGGSSFDLDKIHNTLIPERRNADDVTEHSWVVLVEPGNPAAYPITGVTTRHRSDFGISKRVTRLSVNLGEDSESPPTFSRRETEIHAESHELVLAKLRVLLPEPIQGDEIPVAAAVPGLTGRTVIVRGRPASLLGDTPHAPGGAPITAILPDGETLSLRVEAPDENEDSRRVADENGFIAELHGATEIVQWDEDADPIYEIVRVALAPESTPVLILAEPLRHVYDWRSVEILGNVVPATHGETVTEVLGSGDGLLRNQRFKLSKPPLTFVPAPNVTGRESTLQIRVNGVLWGERDSLLRLTPTDESFAVRIQNEGTTEITFGDGVRGARIPSGAENVVASYRSGLGAEGEVEADQLALLKTKPLGIREVTNPLPATGAEPPETEAETRENAPLTVLVLGRVVSIQDYEDFSRTFPGVGKAQAVPMWDGFTKFAHLTIGTQGGVPLVPGSPLYDSLLGALDNVRDTHQLVIIAGYTARSFGLKAKVLVDQRYEPEPVLQAIDGRLREAFSYEAREFGQDVTAAEIVAAVHEIAGVVAVDLDELYFVQGSNTTSEDEPAATQRLEARLAYLEDGEPRPAELLLIDAREIALEVMT